MSTRPNDEVVIASADRSGAAFQCDRVTSFEFINDLLQPAQCLVEIGDDGTWKAAADAIRVGGKFVVWVNGRPRMKGRMIAPRMPLSASTGATVQLTIRSVLADASFASCSPTVNIRKGTLKDVLLSAYEPLGLTEADFILDADLAVDLMTGQGKGSRTVVLDDIKEDQAKVAPPETIYNFVERHLSRFHLSHWDAVDGRIVVGAPDDGQSPVYTLQALQPPAGKSNNVIKAERTQDFEQVPTHLAVFGVGGGKEYTKAKVRALERDTTLVDATLHRPVIVIDDAMKTQGQAESRAAREMSLRSRQKDTWRIECDGLSYWNGEERVPWGVDTVADVRCDLIGGPASGPYLVTRCSLRGDADSGYTTNLDLVAKGLWRI